MNNPNPLFQLAAAGNAAPALTPEQLAARKAQKLANLKARLAQQASMAIAQYDRANRQGIAAIFADSDYSPAEALEALGVDAARIIGGSAAATAHIAQVCALAGAAYEPPALPDGVVLALNEDGTVTITLA